MFCDGMLDPTFLDKRNEQRAGFLAGTQAACFQSSVISVAADGGFRPDHNDFLVFCRGCGGLGPGLDNSDNGHACCGLDSIERQRGRRIAGDDQHVGPVGLEKLRRFHCITAYRLDGFRSVRQPGRVTEVGVIGGGNAFEHSLENGKAAKAGIEDADDGATKSQAAL